MRCYAFLGWGEEVNNYMTWFSEAHFASISALAEVSATLSTSPPQMPRDRTSPPIISPDWVATVLINRSRNGQLTDKGKPSLFAQEVTKQRRALLNFAKFPIVPIEWVGTYQEWYNITTLEAPQFVGISFNGNSYAYAMPNASRFTDLFGFLKGAKDSGQTTFKGKVVHRWTLQVKLPTFEVQLEALIDEFGQPVKLLQATAVQGVNQYESSYEFLSFMPGQTAPELWVNFNETQSEHPLNCSIGPSEDFTTLVTDMYIFHPENKFDVAGQDLADLTGETIFVCLDVISNQTSPGDHNYSWLTKWEVEHLAIFGQYANCNGYSPPSCFGKETFLVGHEASYYLGRQPAQLRQCHMNPQVGEWYSLPMAGECKDGATPAYGVCSWRKVRRVKTIEGKCLFTGGKFRNVCLHDARAPFSQSQRMLKTAFDSDDPKEGGCQPIPVSERTKELVV